MREFPPEPVTTTSRVDASDGLSYTIIMNAESVLDSDNTVPVSPYVTSLGRFLEGDRLNAENLGLALRTVAELFSANQGGDISDLLTLDSEALDGDIAQMLTFVCDLRRRLVNDNNTALLNVIDTHQVGEILNNYMLPFTSNGVIAVVFDAAKLNNERAQNLNVTLSPARMQTIAEQTGRDYINVVEQKNEKITEMTQKALETAAAILGNAIISGLVKQLLEKLSENPDMATDLNNAISAVNNPKLSLDEKYAAINALNKYAGVDPAIKQITSELRKEVMAKNTVTVQPVTKITPIDFRNLPVVSQKELVA